MLVNGNIVELRPTDSHKSFYGKARVVMAENGDKTLSCICSIIKEG